MSITAINIPSRLQRHECAPHRVPASPSVCLSSYKCHVEPDWRTDTLPTPCSRTVEGAHLLGPYSPVWIM